MANTARFSICGGNVLLPEGLCQTDIHIEDVLQKDKLCGADLYPYSENSHKNR